jgi:ricin-type beta-trefoil lectin protein
VHFQGILNVGLCTLLCAALTSTNASAATLRMVIQSPPEVGGKCLEVPNRQFVSQIRLQMWDCNNSVAQIFSYDDTNHQLMIGNLCVESWGSGVQQDAVGIGACNGGANQHWRMVASRDYYQIVGMNNQCLTLRNGVKDNGAALDIFDCNASVPQRLWALLEAPPASTPTK